MQRFYKTFSELHLNIFVPNVFNKINLPGKRQVKCVLLLITRRRVFLPKNVARLLCKTVSKKENESLVQIKLISKTE